MPHFVRTFPLSFWHLHFKKICRTVVFANPIRHLGFRKSFGTPLFPKLPKFNPPWRQVVVAITFSRQHHLFRAFGCSIPSGALAIGIRMGCILGVLKKRLMHSIGNTHRKQSTRCVVRKQKMLDVFQTIVRDFKFSGVNTKPRF